MMESKFIASSFKIVKYDFYKSGINIYIITEENQKYTLIFDEAFYVPSLFVQTSEIYKLVVNLDGIESFLRLKYNSIPTQYPDRIYNFINSEGVVVMSLFAESLVVLK